MKNSRQNLKLSETALRLVLFFKTLWRGWSHTAVSFSRRYTSRGGQFRSACRHALTLQHLRVILFIISIWPAKTVPPWIMSWPQWHILSTSCLDNSNMVHLSPLKTPANIECCNIIPASILLQQITLTVSVSSLSSAPSPVFLWICC